MSNSFRKTSCLHLDVRIDENNKTYMKDAYFTTPFKVKSPFDLGDGKIKILIMAASAGILSGDRHEFKFKLADGTNTIITSQSYEKVHKMDGECARRELTAEVGSNATLQFVPQPTIPFAKSKFENDSVFKLKDKTSKLLFHEILCCGRKASGELFKYGFYTALTQIFVGDELIYRDNTRYFPEEMDMSGIGMYESYTHLSNQVIVNYGDAKEIIAKASEILAAEEEDIQYGFSQLASGDVIIRVLGREGNILEIINQKITDAIEA